MPQRRLTHNPNRSCGSIGQALSGAFSLGYVAFWVQPTRNQFNNRARSPVPLAAVIFSEFYTLEALLEAIRFAPHLSCSPRR
jgi:hypothetical protein